MILGVGMASFTLGDLYHLFVLQDLANPPFPSLADLGWFAFCPVAAGSYEPGGIIDMTWSVAFVLMSAAPWVRAAPRQAAALEGRRMLVAPATFAGVSLAMLILDHFFRVETLGFVLASLALAAVVARITLTVRQHLALLGTLREEARTDALTRFSNRRQLLVDLEWATDGDAPSMLVQYDLDGFKAYNDRFGHVAGDELLVRLGRRLAAAVDGRGRAYRLGGDEICLVGALALPGEPGLAEVGLGALAEKGDGYEVAASHGSAVLPDEASTTADALILVDQRMYADRRARRTSSSALDGGRRLMNIARPA